MSIEAVFLIILAGFLAGAINAAAGGGTLVTFPVLIWLGIPPISANMSSSVGLISGYLGGSIAYRRELAVQKDRVIRFAAVSVVGAVIGALLLITTPERVFSSLVPYLVLGSAGLLAIQPRLTAFFAKRSENSTPSPSRVGVSSVLAQTGVLVGSIYGSYFGAGLGVLLLAVLALTIADDLQKLNGLKSLLSLLVNIVGVLVFVTNPQVNWLVVAFLAPAAFLGGTVGGGLARKLKPSVLRGFIVLFALASGIALLLN